MLRGKNKGFSYVEDSSDSSSEGEVYSEDDEEESFEVKATLATEHVSVLDVV
jgi:hypothetical protein